jgi:hypothetical protein
VTFDEIPSNVSGGTSEDVHFVVMYNALNSLRIGKNRRTLVGNGLSVPDVNLGENSSNRSRDTGE